MKIAVINDIHLGKDLEISELTGKTRAASSLGWERVPKLLTRIEQKHQPDLFIQGGDLIRSDSEQEDTKNYNQALSCFSKLKTPVIHTLGNHEIRKLDHQNISDIWQQLSIDQPFFGSIEIQGIQIIWLGIENSIQQAENFCVLPEEQLTWLDKTLQQSQKPTIIFSHMAWNNQDMHGNYYFETLGKAKAHYWNQQSIQDIVKNHSNILGIFSAHVHWLYANTIFNIPFCSLPSMVENIASPEIDTVFPEVYSIVEIREKCQVTLTCYSREFAFFKTEL